MFYIHKIADKIEEHWILLPSNWTLEGEVTSAISPLDQFLAAIRTGAVWSSFPLSVLREGALISPVPDPRSARRSLCIVAGDAARIYATRERCQDVERTWCAHDWSTELTVYRFAKRVRWMVVRIVNPLELYEPSEWPHTWTGPALRVTLPPRPLLLIPHYSDDTHYKRIRERRAQLGGDCSDRFI